MFHLILFRFDLFDLSIIKILINILFWLSWIDEILSIRYHGVTIHHDTHGQHGICSLCIITSLPIKRKT